MRIGNRTGNRLGGVTWGSEGIRIARASRRPATRKDPSVRGREKKLSEQGESRKNQQDRKPDKTKKRSGSEKNDIKGKEITGGCRHLSTKRGRVKPFLPIGAWGGAIRRWGSPACDKRKGE